MAKKKKTPEGKSGILHTMPGSDPIRIVPISDLHIGDPNINMKIVNDLIDRVAQDPNTYAVLVGDIMNTAIAGSKSDVYSDAAPPEDQLDRAVELFEPIKDKILAVVPGNHEERISRSVGVDMSRQLSARLGIVDRYDSTAALVYVRMGNSKRHGAPIIYSIYVNHGHGGGGRRAGSKINCLQDLGYVIDADVIIAGHTHMPATFRTSQMRCVPQKFSYVLHEQVFVNTASAIEYGGYGQRGGYQPPSNAYPIITLDPAVKKVTVTL